MRQHHETTAYNWRDFLAQWSKDVLTTEHAQDLPPEVRAAGWLGYPGATEAEIALAEARLNASLPPSYRAFLAASNGFRLAGSLVPRLFSTEEIEWFHVRDPEAVTAWTQGAMLFGPTPPVTDEEYFVYGSEQDTCTLRPEYLKTALQISESETAGTAVLLLNPQVVTDDGEWEAWYFAHWLPGASRYRSFWELMQAEYQTFISLEEHERKRLQPDDDLQVLPDKLAGLIEELQARIERLRSLKSEQPGTPQYHMGVVDGLEYAEARIREIQAQVHDPQALYEQLSALADDLEIRSQRGVRADKVKTGADLARILLRGIDNYIRSKARLEGYREAAGVVRWFLNEG